MTFYCALFSSSLLCFIRVPSRCYVPNVMFRLKLLSCFILYTILFSVCFLSTWQKRKYLSQLRKKKPLRSCTLALHYLSLKYKVNWKCVLVKWQHSLFFCFTWCWTTLRLYGTFVGKTMVCLKKHFCNVKI